jgi:hypothetical protein
VSTILSFLNPVAFSVGTLFSITGASVSFGPPVGATITAHLGKKRLTKKMKKKLRATIRFKLIDIYFGSKFTNLYIPFGYYSKLTRYKKH